MNVKVCTRYVSSALTNEKRQIKRGRGVSKALNLNSTITITFTTIITISTVIRTTTNTTSSTVMLKYYSQFLVQLQTHTVGKRVDETIFTLFADSSSTADIFLNLTGVLCRSWHLKALKMYLLNRLLPSDRWIPTLKHYSMPKFGQFWTGGFKLDFFSISLLLCSLFKDSASFELESHDSWWFYWPLPIKSDSNQTHTVWIKHISWVSECYILKIHFRGLKSL